MNHKSNDEICNCVICEAPIEQEIRIARPTQPYCLGCGNEIEAVHAQRRLSGVGVTAKE